LKRLLPICSYCKRIRSDQDYWEQVDSYISEHVEAQHSHSICPTCYEAVAAEFDGVEKVSRRSGLSRGCARGSCRGRSSPSPPRLPQSRTRTTADAHRRARDQC